MEKIEIGISACLLGESVRYDGGHKHDRYITDTLGQYFEWVPVCPEVESGLPIPREAMHLTGNPEAPRLVTVKTHVDQTDRMLQWAEKKLKLLEKESLCGFIFKSRSPSSGIGGVKIYTDQGMPRGKTAGIFGGAFMKHLPLVPVIDDGRLHDLPLRENFIERVFVFRRWQEFSANEKKLRDMIAFHTDLKLLVMSHSPKHYSMLGRLIAEGKKYRIEKLMEEYFSGLMEGLRYNATVKKNTNVLLHIIGYFKKKLEDEDRKELLEIIEHYHRGHVPLIVPMIMIIHYVKKYDEPYLKRQYYLNPHPVELMLRNHS